jgi:hypothetical protein
MIIEKENHNYDAGPHEGIRFRFLLGDDTTKLYAILIIDCFADVALIHPELLYPTKSNLVRLRKEMFDVGMPIMRKYKYDEAHFLTHNKKFIDLLVGDKAEFVATIENQFPLYRYSLEGH